MAKTRRAQIPMDPAEYARLEEIARRKGVSMAELIRAALRQLYLIERSQSEDLVDEICGMDIRLDDWDKLEKEIEQAHGDSLP